MADKKKANATPTAFEQLPSMLSYARSISPGRGLFYSASDLDGGASEPLLLQTQGVRGSKAYDIWQKIEKEKRGKDKNGEAIISESSLKDCITPNPQRIDTAFLPEDKPYLKAQFNVKYLGNSQKPKMCNNLEIEKALRSLSTGFAAKGGYAELARRYVVPLVTGLWMWRNNEEAVEKQIRVTDALSKEQYVFRPGYNVFTLHQLSEEEQSRALALAEKIRKALEGQATLMLNVEAIYHIGAGMPVYPSQEMTIDDDSKEGKVSRVFYRVKSNGVDNQVGLHDVKIGNALRTIDVWHEHELFDAIAVEPLGVIGTHMISTRVEDKRDFYSLVKINLLLWLEDLESDKALSEIRQVEELMFVMAVLIRGGAFV